MDRPRHLDMGGQGVPSLLKTTPFFNIGCFVFQLEGGSAKYVRFNHNTIVECGRQLTQSNWWQNAYIANNLIINGFWQGEGTADLTGTGRDRDRAYKRPVHHRSRCRRCTAFPTKSGGLSLRRTTPISIRGSLRDTRASYSPAGLLRRTRSTRLDYANLYTSGRRQPRVCQGYCLVEQLPGRDNGSAQ